jgi:hypothetical protein
MCLDETYWEVAKVFVVFFLSSWTQFRGGRIVAIMNVTKQPSITATFSQYGIWQAVISEDGQISLTRRMPHISMSMVQNSHAPDTTS